MEALDKQKWQYIVMSVQPYLWFVGRGTVRDREGKIEFRKETMKLKEDSLPGAW